MPIRVGDQAVTESRLYPTGVVRIGHERLDARSTLGPVESGVPVVVIGDGPDGLMVRPINEGTPPDQLPNFGQEVYRSPQHRTTALTAQQEAAIQEEIAKSGSVGRQWSGVVGAVSLAGATAVRWSWLSEQVDSPAVFVVAAVLLGGAWGFGFFELVYYVLWNMDTAHRRIATATSLVGVLSSALAAGLLVPLLGLLPGLLAAGLMAIVFAALIPTAIMVLGN